MFLDFLSYAIAWTPGALFFGVLIAFSVKDVTWKGRILIGLFGGYIGAPLIMLAIAVVAYAPFWAVGFVVFGSSYIRGLL